VEKLMKNFFLFLSKNKSLTKAARKYGLRFGASKFVPGETIDQAVKVIRELNNQGMSVTTDYLGEFVSDEKVADERVELSIKMIEAIDREKLDAQYSLKMTSMGMDISDEVVLRNMRRILEAGKKHNVVVTIDMEDSGRCQKTLDIFKELKSEYDNLSTVVQTYLYRTETDIDDLNKYKPNLRIVKGAYKEPVEVAFPDKKDVDDNFKKIVKKHMLNGNFTAVASHDMEMIDYTKQIAKEYNIPKDQYEFQMLYGICTDLHHQLVKEGYNMRVYLAFGTDWFGYYMRRLAERPANVAFVLKGMFK
jgi:proline dehydrogenase